MVRGLKKKNDSYSVSIPAIFVPFILDQVNRLYTG